MSFGQRAYRALLHLYPARFRERFGDEMLAMYMEDARRKEARWARMVADACMNAPAERVRDYRQKRTARLEHHTCGTHDELAQANHGDGMLTTLGQDIRYALRGMLRQPAFTLVVLATLALGIGANTAIFSVVNGILVRALPYSDPDRIMHFRHETPYQSVSEGEFLDYRRDLRSFSKLAAFNSGDVSLTSGDDPTRVLASRVSSDFFEILGTRAELGRVFSADDFKRGGPRIGLLSQALWKSRFASDSTLIGRDIQVSGRPLTVIGVLPERFDYPSTTTAIWTPMRLNPDSLWGRNNHYMEMIGRLVPGASIQSASAEANILAARWRTMFPETYGDKTLITNIRSLEDSITGSTRPFLIALLGAVGFVLLIACVNVANLFLARGEARQKEVAIRAALGASHGRLSAQFVTESLFFAVAGGALGLFVAYGAQKALIAAAPPSIPRVADIHLDGTVLAFTGALVIATGLLFGLYPALRVARSRSFGALREGGRAFSSGVGFKFRRAMVISEVALAVVMLAGAGVMLRSLWRLQQTELGFDPANILTAQVALPNGSYDQARAVAFYDDVTRKLAATPGAVSAAAAYTLPIASGGSRWSVMINNVVLHTIGESPSLAPQQVTPAYFKLMGTPIMQGRGFTELDRLGAPFVALVNEAAARELWKGESPIGKTIKMFDSTAPWATIVGIVKDTRAEGIAAPVPPTMYFPHSQATRSNYGAGLTMTLVVKTKGKPESFVPALREIVRSMDPLLPITSLRSMDDVLASSIADRRFSTTLLLLFAVLAMVLAGIGIYGVIAFSVSMRTYEIGVRVALGAHRSSVIGLVLKQSLAMTAIGIVVGLIGAGAVNRAARSMLVGTTSYDPTTFGVAAVSILAVALLAGVVPVRRALRVDPIAALRNE